MSIKKTKKHTALVMVLICFASLWIVPFQAKGADVLTAPTVAGTSPAVFSSVYTPVTDSHLDEIGFEYATKLDFSNHTFVGATSPAALGVPFSASASLSENTTYYVRARARVTINGAQELYYSAYTTYDTTKLRVITDSAFYSDGTIYAQGSTISGTWGSEKGFVYSSNDAFPTLINTSISLQTSANPFLGDFKVSTSNSRYYVRAYAYDAAGQVVYADNVIFVNTSSANTPTVRTDSIDYVDDYSARIVIDVTSSGNSSVTERGVLYSWENSNPTLDSSNCYTRSVSGTTGSATVTISNLRYNTRYYVRAYARNSYGDSYGNTLSFTTGEYWDGGSTSSDLRTSEVKEVTSNSARAYGYIYRTNDSSLWERGFVYSSSATRPTTSDYKVYDTVYSTGSYNIRLNNLSPGTTYYLRAYYRTNAYTYYGNVLQFTTLAGSGASDGPVTTTVMYKLASGETVNSQTVKSYLDAVLTETDLSIPVGYRLYSGTWTYTIKDSGSVSVLVMPIAGMESVFMPSAGNYQFKPDTPMTRREVAQAIYSLSDKITNGTPTHFTDVNGTDNAIDYVSAMNYMVGYPDGTFRPDNTLTRMEMAVILCTVYDLTGTETCGFRDISLQSWGYNYVALATRAGIINGYPDNTFRPGNAVTRAETCVLLSRAEKRTLTPLGVVNFADVTPSHWAYRYIMNAATPMS